MCSPCRRHRGGLLQVAVTVLASWLLRRQQTALKTGFCQKLLLLLWVSCIIFPRPLWRDSRASPAAPQVVPWCLRRRIPAHEEFLSEVQRWDLTSAWLSLRPGGGGVWGRLPRGCCPFAGGLLGLGSCCLILVWLFGYFQTRCWWELPVNSPVMGRSCHHVDKCEAPAIFQYCLSGFNKCTYSLASEFQLQLVTVLAWCLILLLPWFKLKILHFRSRHTLEEKLRAQLQLLLGRCQRRDVSWKRRLCGTAAEPLPGGQNLHSPWAISSHLPNLYLRIYRSLFWKGLCHPGTVKLV